MQSHPTCVVRLPRPSHARERGVRAVVALTATMMVVEIAAGYATGSMALAADGWHMATHVGAFGMAALAYTLSRRLASHDAFAFGTGKIHALAGYSSATILAIAALVVMIESASRLAGPKQIDYSTSLPIAVVGLAVNLLSIWLLHDREHEHEHDDDHDDDHDHHHAHRDDGRHDHNHRAAVLHVIADVLTSTLAIVALLAGPRLGWRWLDPVTGMVGGVVILVWAFGLCRHACRELLDFRPAGVDEAAIRGALEALGDVHVRDLHVWSLGGGRLGGVITLASPTRRESITYRSLILEKCPVAHLTIEIEALEAARLTLAP
jgi:cation diffusion facilitator family transporter